MRKTSAAIVGLIILLIACAAFAAVTFTEAPGTAPAERAASSEEAQPGMEFAPYVQNVTPTGATIMWEANASCFGDVKISDGQAEQTYRTTHALRLGEVRVQGLQPDTTYTYSVTLASSPKTAVRSTFHTFPEKSNQAKFIVYGDTRSNPARHKAVIDAMAKERDVEFVLHTGDLVADGRKTELWAKEFFGPTARMMRSVPFYTVLGNHEHDSSNYFRFLSLPGKERWYSFDVGDVHIIALDSNVTFEMGSDQYQWLMGDLAAHKDARWKFVVMHHPTYSSGPHSAVMDNGEPRELPMRQAQKLMPYLAKEYGIQAIFAGHDHSYERSTNDGVQYVVSGGGGAENYSDTNAAHNPYRKVFDPALHYCVITINGSKGTMIVKTPRGKVIDRVELTSAR